MSHALIASIVGLTAALVCASTLIPLRRAAIRLDLLDQPGERRVHRTPVPRLGGLAIFLGFLVALSLSFILPVDRFEQEVERILLLVLGGSILVGTMFFDDTIGIPPIPKLGIQIGVALIVIAPRIRGETHGIIIDQFNAPFFGAVSLPMAGAMAFTLLWIVGMMNSMNWADGIDGLAGSIGLVASVVLFLHTYFRPHGDPQFTISLLAIALAGAIVGFLPFNWHPARIIMGDTGAMFLGFALATISIIGGAKIATALLALGVPILDMAWVILYRIAHGRSPLRADRGHLHHRMLDAGLTQPQVVACFAGLTAVFGALALALPSRGEKLAAIAVMGGILLLLIAALAFFRPRGSSQTG